jgi:hypothetical protein
MEQSSFRTAENLDKNFPVFNATGMFVSVFTAAGHWTYKESKEYSPHPVNLTHTRPTLTSSYQSSGPQSRLFPSRREMYAFPTRAMLNSTVSWYYRHSNNDYNISFSILLRYCLMISVAEYCLEM